MNEKYENMKKNKQKNKKNQGINNICFLENTEVSLSHKIGLVLI